MQIPGVHIETLAPPQDYTLTQIEQAIRIAELMDRGKLVLCTPPLGNPQTERHLR